LQHLDDDTDAIREMTDERGTDSVIDAVDMEARGSRSAKLGQQITGLLPDSISQRFMKVSPATGCRSIKPRTATKMVQKNPDSTMKIVLKPWLHRAKATPPTIRSLVNELLRLRQRNFT
jgi:hypothetical protein